MQRRAELARAMINNPQIMILDEPFRGLDAMTKELMWEYYSALYEENRRTNFFVTTDIDEAIFLADRAAHHVEYSHSGARRVRSRRPAPAPARRSHRERPGQSRSRWKRFRILHEEAMKSFSRGSKAAADFVDAYSRAHGEDLSFMDWVLSRETMIALAVLGATCSVLATLPRIRAAGLARSLNAAGYALMGASMLSSSWWGCGQAGSRYPMVGRPLAAAASRADHAATISRCSGMSWRTL